MYPEEQPRKTHKKTNSRTLINLSLIVFGVSIIVFTAIGALVMDNFSNLQQLEDLSHMDEDNYKGQIDDRLRFIAMQDDDKVLLRERESSPIEEELSEPNEIIEFLNNESEEIKKSKFEEYNEQYKKKTSKDKLNAENLSDEIPYKKETVKNTALNLKVVIGSFATKEAAQEELLLISSQFTAPPFIKFIDGKYVLQVASFKTPETAYEFANSLRQQGYSARIIEE